MGSLQPLGEDAPTMLKSGLREVVESKSGIVEEKCAIDVVPESSKSKVQHLPLTVNCIRKMPRSDTMLTDFVTKLEDRISLHDERLDREDEDVVETIGRLIFDLVGWVCIFVMTALIMLWIWFVEPILYLINSDTRYLIPSLPDAKTTKERGKHIPIPVLHADDIEPDTLGPYLRRSEPFIIKGMDPKLFREFDNFTRDPVPEHLLPESYMMVDSYLLTPVWGLRHLHHWMRKNVTYWPIVNLIHIRGPYGAVCGHMDQFKIPTINVGYYVKKGGNKIWLVPRQYNSMIKYAGHGCGQYIVGDNDGMDHLGWVDDIPGVYDFELVEGDFLMFNNSALVHKFATTSPETDAYQFRYLNWRLDSSPVVLFKDIFNISLIFNGVKSALTAKTFIR